MILYFKQVSSLWLRDLRHFFRQRSRVLGAIGQPFVFWIFLSAGFSGSFTSSTNAGYGDYIFPGVIMLIALFSAIFSTISVIEDRTGGFLQGVLTAPVPRHGILVGKMLAGTTLALAQTGLFFLLLPFTSLSLSFAGIFLGVIVIVFAGSTLTLLGFLISWRMNSTQGFHAIMNLVLLPAWILSGALFPPEGASVWMQWIIKLNPVYYISSLFQYAFFFGGANTALGGPGIVPALVFSVLTFLILFIVAFREVRLS